MELQCSYQADVGSCLTHRWEPYQITVPYRIRAYDVVYPP